MYGDLFKVKYYIYNNQKLNINNQQLKTKHPKQLK